MKKVNIRRITHKNIKTMLEGWPQAIDADGGDLRNLHDIANAGAQGWGEKLYWPDYLWLGLDDSRPSNFKEGHFQQRLLIESPDRQDDADFGIIDKIPIRPKAGDYKFSGQIDCIIELKTIKVDHAKKFSAYSPQTDGATFLRKKLRNALMSQLEHADKQIFDGKRLIGLTEARGVTLLVNECSPGLIPDAVCAFLAKAIYRLKSTDAIVYLSDRPHKYAYNVIVKDPGDQVVSRFSSEFASMLQSVKWGEDGKMILLSQYPKLTVKIDVEKNSREMIETWSTGWRVDTDPAPIPEPSIRLSIVQTDEFVSGLK